MWCLVVLNNTETLSVQKHTNTSNDTHTRTYYHQHCITPLNTDTVSTKKTQKYYHKYCITPLNTDTLSVQNLTLTPTTISTTLHR